MQLENKVAAVTGSSLGIGRAIALAFGREGPQWPSTTGAIPKKGQKRSKR